MFSRSVLILLSFVHFLCTDAYDFKDPSYDDLLREAYALQGPFASVTNANLLLGIEEVTSTNKHGQPWKCSPTVMRVSNVQTLNADVERPQLMLSGEIHGNERVGPIASVIAARLMVLATECLGVNKIYLAGSGAGRGAGTGKRNAEQQKACTELSNDFSITDPDHLNWLAMLAAKRDTFVLPTANCYGYHHNTRSDKQVDVNRDFGYLRKDENCLMSTTAKMFHALMMQSMLQVVVTFHGGMQAIGYEWGSPNHAGNLKAEQSPDDLANRVIGGSMQVLGGADGKKARKGFTAAYPTGPMNSLVYPVEGGMEDWMYAAGWDKGNGNVHKCGKNNKNGEVPDNRALVFLIETSDEKQPRDKDLGGSDHILVHDATAGSAADDSQSAGGNGHVPRNVRAALVAIDTVQPYVCIKSVAAEGTSINLQWSVGGGAKVDATWLEWHAIGASEEEMYSHAGDDTYLRSVLPTPLAPPSGSAAAATTRTLREAGRGRFKGMGMGMGGNNRFRRARTATPAHGSVAASEVQSGLAQWGKAAAAASIGGKAPPPSAIADAQNPLLHPFHAAYKSKAIAPAAGSVNAKIVGEEDFYWLVAWAGVDHAFGKIGQGMPEELGPQGYLANARSNAAYRKSNPLAVGLRSKEDAVKTFPPQPAPAAKPAEPLSARVVQGHKYWPSEPVLVAVHRTSGVMRVAAAATSCAFWERQSFGIVPPASGAADSSAAAAAAAAAPPATPPVAKTASEPAAKNIGDGGSVLGADGHGQAPAVVKAKAKPELKIEPVLGVEANGSNSVGASFAGGLSEQLTIIGSTDANDQAHMPDSSNIFARLYVLLGIMGSCMVVFWGAKRAFINPHPLHVVERGGKKSDWTRNANFVKV